MTTKYNIVLCYAQQDFFLINMNADFTSDPIIIIIIAKRNAVEW